MIDNERDKKLGAMQSLIKRKSTATATPDIGSVPSLGNVDDERIYSH